MDASKRQPRRLLTVAEAQAVAEDLRHERRDRIEGARFPAGFQLQVGTIRGVSFTNCHLWLTVGGGMFRGGMMEDCRFVDVALDPLTVIGSDIRANAFERVTFGVGATGRIDDSLIEGGSFIDCRFLDVGFRKTILRDVTIEGGRMDRVRFAACTFVDTRLASSLRDVTVTGSGFDGMDLSESDVVDVTFDGWRSADLRLPERRTGFFVTPAAASAALASVLSDLTIALGDRFFADVILAGSDVVAVSERYFTNALGAGPREASLLVDALFPYRLDSLAAVHRDGSRAGR